MCHRTALFILCCLSLGLRAQPLRTDLPLTDAQGTPLPQAWAGGLQAPQFSNLDLDADGTLDLVVFDRADGTLLPFLQRGTLGTDSLVYAPTYRSRFPQRLDAWVLLADANCDGRPDLFTHNYTLPSTIWLYLQGADGRFDTAPISLRSSYQGFGALLYSSLTDLPGIADVDGDGDLDLLSFEVVSGEQVIWHRNFALEDLGRCDTLLLRAQTDCFGRFLEDYDAANNTFTALLDQDCANYKTSHIGGALLPVNLNGDSLMDLLVSDVGPRTVMALHNGGTRLNARFTAVENGFPQADTPVNIDYFPGMFLADADADGSPDLICAPNEAEGVQDRDGVWCYRNTGAPDSLVPELLHTGWLQAGMPDLGTGSMPTLADVDGDGLIDLLVAHESAWLAPGQTDCAIALWRNVGTAVAPRLQETAPRWLSKDTHPTLTGCGWKPALASLYADGRRTLVLGNLNGTLTLLETAANPTPDAPYTVVQTNWLALDQLSPQPSVSQPLFADVDTDGDQDLVIGTARGRLIFYENTGTAGSPTFTLRSTYWGGVWVRDSQHPILGYASTVVAQLDGQGPPELLVGNRSGHLLVYRGLSTQAAAVFDSLGPLYPQPIGAFARPTAARLFSGQDSLTVVIGGARGGMHLLKLGTILNLSRIAPTHLDVQVWPQPAHDVLWLRLPVGTQQATPLQLRNALGQTVAVLPAQPTSADTYMLTLPASLPTGLYLLQGQTGSGTALAEKVWVGGW